MMRDDHPDADAIKSHRILTEQRLARLLEESGIGLPVAAIQSVIFDYHHTRFKSFAAQMREMFESSGIRRIDKAATLGVIQDAWNYFPHQSLGGKCPAELMLESL